ncbi:band 4.1-like protein 3 isoform X18 [Dendrobates tinctorius]|uniref:band 4.1-like protein 3 isoform X18 n=1 Tax=Dendrobates tinctorius TaxID=92724 RepID=UPI003CC99BE0
MTLETGSDSSATKQDQEKDQKATGVTLPGQQPGEDHKNVLEHFPEAAAHSTPLKSEKNSDKDWDKEAAAAKQLEYQQLEDDKVSQKSVSSKLSKSPLKSAKRPKNMLAKVTLLDGSEYTCEVEKRSKGQVLFDKVCEHLNLLEKDYFGLVYRDLENQKNWLDPAKEIKKQTRNGSWHFSFNVKFYPPDPSQLSEDITRYYLCLQLRDDIVSGRLPCSFVTLALLGSYTVQSELGDYDPDEYGSDYVSEFRFAPNQTKELEDKVVELHKSYRGMTPAEAEMHFLENAKKLSMYGVDLHHAKDSEGVEIMLGVCASGLLIYRDRLRINRFAWPKVLKISYKRNNFYIKIRPGEFEQFESTIGFKLPNHRAAKRLWKVCVEHHTFFRLLLPEAPPKKFLTLGSKFRYSGRTQAQTRRASALIDRPAPYFERSSSKRYTMSRSLDGASVNENHDLYMKDSVSATEVGTGPYITTKGASQTNLIASATPEKKVEEEKKEEEEKAKKVEVVTTVTTIRHDTKTDSEQTDTAADGETTATESDQEEDTDVKTQEFDRNQEDLMKHQTNISELKRTFLETSAETATSEWEKRLSTSPVRLAARQDEAPMIEPLVPEETKEEKEEVERRASLERTSYSMLESQPGDIVKKLREARATSPVATSHQIIMQKTIPSSPETKQSSGDKLMDGSDIYSLLESTRKPSEFRGEVTTTSQNWAQKMETNTEWESSGITEKEDTEQRAKEKVVQGIISLEETGAMHASGDAACLASEQVDGAEQASTIIASGLKESVGAALTEKAAKEEDGAADASAASNAQEEQHGKTSHDMLDGKPLEESPLVKTEIITFGTIAEAEKPDIATKDVPVIHTETKTITYESSEMVSRPDTDPGVLMSAQTITSETLGTTTTTHITKTVKGGISETRIEKRIVITGDADIDHDQALAQAIKEAKEQHPDMSVTKVVVHKETEITPEDGED